MFFCKECGGETTKWSGKCPHCGAWNSLKEIDFVVKKKGKKKIHPTNLAPRAKVGKISEVNIKKIPRQKTGIGEFDGTLGGGIVSGMAVLIGGEPGIGKSTLMLQVANKIAKNDKIYILEKEGYMVVINKKDFKYRVHEVDFEDGFVFVGKTGFYVADEKILVE